MEVIVYQSLADRYKQEHTQKIDLLIPEKCLSQQDLLFLFGLLHS